MQDAICFHFCSDQLIKTAINKAIYEQKLYKGPYQFINSYTKLGTRRKNKSFPRNRNRRDPDYNIPTPDKCVHAFKLLAQFHFKNPTIGIQVSQKSFPLSSSCFPKQFSYMYVLSSQKYSMVEKQDSDSNPCVSFSFKLLTIVNF